MARELVKPGCYLGRILAYGVKKTSKGDPAPTIAFEVVDKEGTPHKVYWQGSFNGKALEFTMEALMVCGLRNGSKLVHLAEGAQSGILDMQSEYELDISIDTDPNNAQKKWNRVNWINAVGSSKFKDAITVQEFAPLLNERNLAAEFQRIAAEKGYELNQGFTRHAIADENIPF